MPEFYSRDLIERVKDALDVVDVISSYLPLRKSGANYIALCPFHTEKTPSFSVSRAKQIFHCFGCGEGGNVISFVMKYENLPFADTLKTLADRAGISLPKKKEPEDFSRIYKINKAAVAFYRRQLKSATEKSISASYVVKRGIRPEMLDKFEIGYAPDSWDACFKHLSADFRPEEMEKAGLIKKSSKGNYIDRFRKRLMFPIFDEKGSAIAFGGRLLGDDSAKPGKAEFGSAPKYLNSPDSRVYNKSRVLYGLNLAAEHIRKADGVLVVEGYTDVISLYHAGIKNVVATSGTAFTPYHCRTLKRFTGNFVMIFDGDDAGRKAATRATQIAMEALVRPKVALLSAGFDPDTLVRTGGAEAIEEVIKNAKPYMSYLIGLACEKYDIKTPEGRADAARSLLPDLADIKDPIERAGYVEEVSGKLKIPAEHISKRISGPKTVAGRYMKSGAPSRMGANKEKILIRIILDRPDVLEAKLKNLKPENFSDATYRQLFQIVADGVRTGLTSDEIISSAENDEIRRIMRGLILENGLYEEKDWEKNVDDHLAHLKVRSLERKKLMEGMKRAQTENRREDYLELQKNYLKIN